MSRTMWTAVVLTAGLLAGSTGIASAADATPTTGASSGSSSGTGLADLRADAGQDCKLITDLGPAVTDLLAIINGDAATPGSVAWLNAQAARAKSAGHTNLATWLTTRATLRQEQGGVLQTRQQLLTSGASWCQAHGFGTES
ncbi:hypothetical protein Caci_5087 [Catenulispora acidiphila DSM 44928]|uniref:Secreted protein n=1 Tax=Catenulispora acidiphila (strain DSM 44928 / JCM 14897 / NBRC 102108 / NRRL B-24433 / ID139908) TaxID=479433 RepID=C7Q4Z9_CATAD|nr:hypothetical protein [Catenulispora acidiphila]ACU73947.1 hypothetical protein Caci_5087 [Catenulispora acidiphila DSM 44928]